jgi:hypothetical protein
MFLETEAVQARASDMSRLVNRDITTHAGALVVTNCEKVIRITTGEGIKKLTKDCLQTEQIMFFAASFDLAWLLAPFGAFLSALR